MANTQALTTSFKTEILNGIHAPRNERDQGCDNSRQLQSGALRDDRDQKRVDDRFTTRPMKSAAQAYYRRRR